MLQTRIVERIKTHILCSVNLFSENRIMWKKYCRARQATDDKTAYAYFHAGYVRLKTQTQNM